jgi:hypothetical protein
VLRVSAVLDRRDDLRQPAHHLVARAPMLALAHAASDLRDHFERPLQVAELEPGLAHAWPWTSSVASESPERPPRAHAREQHARSRGSSSCG